jgi:2-amino-4-hydroxy-6-hydroxymethyldihydropteridine diphosphokinase
MSQVLLSLGSNINREENISACLKTLNTHFTKVEASPVYESEAVGFDGENFYNLVVLVETDLTVAELSQLLKNIEDEQGRVRGGERFSARTLDIDILTYDDAVGVIDGVELPRDEILSNAFVLLPMADLVPDSKHPVLKQSYQSLWQGFDKSSQKLWQVKR